MPAKVTADYSQFPESIQEVMPHVEGEVMELRNLWSLFHYLFMEGQEISRFGPMVYKNKNQST